jgi:hypothetical protein
VTSRLLLGQRRHFPGQIRRLFAAQNGTLNLSVLLGVIIETQENKNY